MRARAIDDVAERDDVLRSGRVAAMARATARVDPARARAVVIRVAVCLT